MCILCSHTHSFYLFMSERFWHGVRIVLLWGSFLMSKKGFCLPWVILGVLQSTGLQRVGHDWATELNWTFVIWLTTILCWYRGDSRIQAKIIAARSWKTKDGRDDVLRCFKKITDESGSESPSVTSSSLQPHGLYSPWNSPGQNTGVYSHSLLQGFFLTQGSNPALL